VSKKAGISLPLKIHEMKKKKSSAAITVIEKRVRHFERKNNNWGRFRMPEKHELAMKNQNQAMNNK
jgi:hypothetical protein